MKNKSLKKLHITVGLPGSGKTEWAKKYAKSTRNSLGGWRGSYDNCIHYEFDSYRNNRRTDEENKKTFIQSIQNCNVDESIADIFLTTEDQIIDLIKEIDSVYDELIIHYFEPNVETCLWNDRGRREESSRTTIKNAVIEKMTDHSLADKIINEGLEKKIKSVKVELHKVERKPDWKVFYDEVLQKLHIYMDDNGEVRSESWCLGGTWADCWGNGGNVSSDSPPEGFSELDRILEAVCPGITFIQYRRLWSECVYDDQFGDSDYYGGSTTYAVYKFRVSSLYQALVDRELYEIDYEYE
jgi:hypothetical protein